MVPDGVDLVHGIYVVAPHDEPVLTSILHALTASVGVPPACEQMSARELFAGFMVLDAWIANTGRHAENWALVDDQGRRSLLPSFDHGCAFGSGLTDANRRETDIRRFCRMGKTRHYGETRPLLDVAREALQATGAYWWPQRVADVPPEHWRGILGGIEGLSDVARTFMDGILTTNQERVSTLCQR